MKIAIVNSAFLFLLGSSAFAMDMSTCVYDFARVNKQLSTQQAYSLCQQGVKPDCIQNLIYVDKELSFEDSVRYCRLGAEPECMRKLAYTDKYLSTQQKFQMCKSQPQRGFFGGAKGL